LRSELIIDIHAQPDFTTCGPTSLQAVYHYYEDPISLEETIAQVRMLEAGGTLGVLLGIHALKRGYRATIYTYNMHIFDPSWFYHKEISLEKKLGLQLEYKRDDEKLRVASEGYLEYLKLGGNIKYQDLTRNLLRKYLHGGIPILTGLSATYLYNSPREFGPNCDYDDIRGEVSGHFVVLYGLDPKRKKVRVADPLLPNPISKSQYYSVSMSRLLNSILLGIVTYDSNLLIIEPK
jgi:hypothetical protein